MEIGTPTPNVDETSGGVFRTPPWDPGLGDQNTPRPESRNAAGWKHAT